METPFLNISVSVVLSGAADRDLTVDIETNDLSAIGTVIIMAWIIISILLANYNFYIKLSGQIFTQQEW